MLLNQVSNIQKKVIEFQKKFRQNSKSAAIHLEPISTFKDKSFRTARIDQNYRAIIKAPSEGDAYYLLWVAKHDDAYRWAENKVLTWNQETQSMQMFTAQDVEQSTSEEVVSLDTKETSFFSKFLESDLIKIGVPEILLPSILKIDDFDDLDQAQDYIPEDVFENLYYLLDGADIKQIIFEIEEGKVSAQDQESQLSSFNNQRRFIELTDDEVFNDILSGSLKKWKYYLHPSQRILVGQNFKGSVKVTGGAGTGKTVAALHRLKYLSKLNLPGNRKILFTTFTKALTENLDSLVKGFDIETSKVEIVNIDALVNKLVATYELLPSDFKVFEYNAVKDEIELWEDIVSATSTSFTPEFLRDEYLKVFLDNNIKTIEAYYMVARTGRGKAMSRRKRKEIWELIDQFKVEKNNKKLYYKYELYNLLYDYLNENQLNPYEHCLVDELQDFSNVELRLIRQLVEQKENDLFLVGDPMQGIYSKQIVFSKLGIHIRGKRSRRLRINYRTTEEIKRLAVSVIKDCEYQNFDGEQESKAGYLSLFHGKKPEYQIFKGKNEELEYVIKMVKELHEERQISDIAICARTKNGLKDFRTALHNNEIDYSEKNTKHSGDAISLLTFHSMKGLEFKIVFMVDVNDRTAPKLPFEFNNFDSERKIEVLKSEKSLIYVAMTRAVEHVFLSGTGRQSDLIEL